MALLIVLAMVAIIATLVIIFVFHATANLQTETSRTHYASAEIIADSAGSYVKGLFLTELSTNIYSTSTNIGGITIYTPATATNSIPIRSINSSISPSDTDFFNLIRQSIATTDPNASSDGTATAAQNGHGVGTNIWNLSMLVPGGFTSTSQLPHWIYISRTGGLTNASSTNVIGRFAYNVYDVGGLLNINAAGHPSSMTPQQVSLIRGSVAAADLTQLPGLTASDVDKLIAFRNPGAVTAATYTNCAAAAASAGFLSTVATNAVSTQVFTNNYFFNRQDFLHYARTQIPDFTNAAPYLTTFSRALNTPSWGPSTNMGGAYNYQNNANSAGQANRFFPNVRFVNTAVISHYRDDGTSDANSNYAVQAGMPLLQRRFSLERLNWLTYKGPSLGMDAAIQSCFGLVWNKSQYRWDYYGGSSSIQSSIETLDAVAKENREPNFFELLKAGILSGSLGQSTKASLPLSGYLGTKGVATGTPFQKTMEALTDFQILKIGANIIDCSGAHNYPTILAMNYLGVANEVAGVKDLPYLNGLDASSLNKIQVLGSITHIIDYDSVLAPTYFNPHRVVTTGPSVVPGPSSVTTTIQGTVTKMEIPYATSPGYNLSTLPTITLPTTTDFRTNPSHYHNAGAASSLVGQIPWATTSQTPDVAVFKVYSYETQLPSSLPIVATSTSSYNANIDINALIVSLQYPTYDGKAQKTYSIFSGYPGYSSSMGTAYYATQSDGVGNTSLNGSTVEILWDPRTNRLGPSVSFWRSSAIVDAPPLAPSPGHGIGIQYVSEDDPFGNANFAVSVLFGNWPLGGKQAGAAGGWLNMADPDSICRPADGWLDPSGATTNPYQNGSNVSSASAITSSARPVLLQRAYASIGELGYVFRDSPWKTLSFFDATSGDAGLLDLFSVSDQPVLVAGKVNLNTRQSIVLQALFSGAGQEPDGSSPFSATQAANLASAYSSFAFDASTGFPTPNLPMNQGQLVNFMSSTQIANAGLDTIKYHREAVVRSLADSTESRTWNILIDVVAQSGQCLAGTAAPSAANFIVQGETHRWISVSIDRYTGQVIDQQIETINE